MSGSKSLASFTKRFFHLTKPPGFRRAFHAAERNGRFGRIQCQRGKESSSREKRKRRVFLCRTVKVKVGGKTIPASFEKIEGRGMLVGVIGRREGRTKELVGGQNQGPEAPPRSKIGQENREKGDVRREAIEKGGFVRSLRGRRSEEMTQSNTSSPRGSKVPLESQSR